MSIKVKRGLAINLPTLEEGELGFTTDSYEMYVGSDNGNILLNNGEILIRRNNGMLQYAQSNRKNQWFDICSLEEIRGDRGVQGIQGIQGVKGDKGDKGERGIQGEKGNPFTYADFTPDQLRALKGEKGDTGAKGERGLTGDKGDRGVGLNYAWSGTRLGVKRDTDAQYTYVDLRGADGKDGKQGERGERGIQGEKGETPSIVHLEKQVSDKSKELDTKFEALTSKQQQDSEVINARDGEVSLNARLERDLAKGKIHFVDVEGSSISSESEEGYLENVEIHGNTWQDANNLSDIRSVGTKVEGQELYEINVTSCGKNLFDGQLELGGYQNSNGEPYESTNVIRGVNYIPIKPDCQYTISNNLNYNFLVHYYDKNYKWINYGGVQSFVTPSNSYYIKIRSAGGQVDLSVKIQIEESTQATPYEPYQEDKLTILSPTPLEKVGDVADRIVCKDGVYGVEKNVKTYIYDGVKFSHNGNVGEFSEYVLTDTITDISSAVVYGICDKLQSIPPNLNKETIYSNMGKIRVRLLSSMTDVEKKALINEAKFKYPTTQPTFIPLPHSQQIKLRTFAERTHITCDTEIEPTIKAQVPKSLGATVNSHTTQIDNLNKELDRVKKLEESTVSTVTTDSSFTTVSETNGGYFKDVKIEGKTLVNLASFSKLNTNTHIATLPSNRTVGTITILNAYKSELIYINIHDDTGYKRAIRVNSNNFVVNLPQGQWVHSIYDNTPHPDKVLIDDLMKDIIILEGDHTDKDLNFFEGLKSVGQDADEISVSSVNENLFSVDKHTTLRQVNDYIETTTYSNHSVEYSLLPDTDYTLSFDKYDNNNSCWVAVVVDGYDTVNNNNANFRKTYRTDINGILRISIRANGINDIGHKIKNVMLTQGTTSKPYASHQSNKKPLLYFNPTTQTWEKPVLREWDSIEKHDDGKYYYHKRSGEMVLNGSEEWQIRKEKTNTIVFRIYNYSGYKITNTYICDKFGFVNVMDIIDEEGLAFDNSGNPHIGINKSRLSNVDLSSFKSWLQTNNVTVVYQLAQEEIYECSNLDLITYSGETNLIVSSGAIQPKITLKVLSNVSNVVKLLQEKVSVLENKFIQGLKQILAGDMYSLAYLLYPEDFERNEHEVKTLEEL